MADHHIYSLEISVEVIYAGLLVEFVFSSYLVKTLSFNLVGETIGDFSRVLIFLVCKF